MPGTIVTAHELSGMLTDLLRTASTDTRLPALCGIQMFGAATEGHTVLVGHSTNNVGFGQATVSAQGTRFPRFLLSRTDTRKLLGALKTIPDEEQVGLRVSATTLTVDAASRRCLSVTEPPATFPDVRRFLDRVPRYDAGTAISYDPARLAPFLQIAKRRETPLLLYPSDAARPSRLVIGPAYRGLLMAQRQGHPLRSVDWLYP